MSFADVLNLILDVMTYCLSYAATPGDDGVEWRHLIRNMILVNQAAEIKAWNHSQRHNFV